MYTLQVITNKKDELIDITTKIKELVQNHPTPSHLCVVFIPHTTAAVTINENADQDVKIDILYGLRKIVPDSVNFKHLEGNSDGHIKASLIGSSEFIPIKNGSLCLGTWQGIYFAEFDGPRTRKVYVSLL
ncbi:UPF0047 protein Bsu YugU [Candidatus Syntrophocurvum alkaliphilum]|uniref:UPF0047 protein Bsu YugU n=1 Tax=Candidatus Syntrophocurvum alkaliphilum TaxID=2293317 RepID=A0A6I6DDZ4_9FIRM|nr:secondary thiamine-phosphate synthase enzyme YjbQ [Candidatus Syntrophocurvum alkaliphilum]QGT99260.1 UPF0047 protein Bsu YugU [Candidatus Syntrophocurvum alkaliphilum]